MVLVAHHHERVVKSAAYKLRVVASEACKHKEVVEFVVCKHSREARGIAGRLNVPNHWTVKSFINHVPLGEKNQCTVGTVGAKGTTVKNLRLTILHYALDRVQRPKRIGENHAKSDVPPRK